MASTASGNIIGYDHTPESGGGGGSLNTFCTKAPRRMFLCDVPLFLKQAAGNDGSDNLVRLMGTVVEIIQTPTLASPSSGTDPESNSRDANSALQTTLQTRPNPINSTYPTQLVHFVIDDGTGSIGVFTRRRVNNDADCNSGISSATSGNFLPAMQQQPYQITNQYQQLPNTNQPITTVTLESILSAPPPPILVGQTIDCIGRIQTDTTDDPNVVNTNNGNSNIPPSNNGMLWLAASSASIVKNPQAVTLRQLELSSLTRARRNDDGNRRSHTSNSNPKNRILVGGDLERKLNPLFHCNREGSVVFNMEHAFNYIKHSKDDGGITPKELALLVGAVERNDMLAVNLAVEQLREDCRIYLNQGKWFPM